MNNYPLSRPYISSNDRKGVTEVLRSDFLSLGPKHRLFEAQFAKKMGTKYAVSVSSGTAGLHLALLAAGIHEGDEVITTPFSFIASANAIIYCGAKPIFCDIEEQTYNIDPKKIEKAITKKTKAILVVHIFGQSANMKAILKIVKKHRLKLIEDACESINATHYGKRVGTFGESAVFAFYPNKQMTTGEGGMIVTNKKRVHDLCVALRNQGRLASDKWLNHEYIGYNYRIDELSASLGITQLRQLPFFINKRRKIAKWYNQALEQYNDIIKTPSMQKHNSHTWFVYVIRILKKNTKRDNVMKRLAKKGIASKPYLPSIHLSNAYIKRFKYSKGTFPISEKISSQTLALPLYVTMNKKDVDEIVQRLISCL